MIRLDTTSRKLQALLGGAAATALDVAVGYRDRGKPDLSAFAVRSKLSTLNSVTPVDIGDAPNAVTIREIDSVQIRNNDAGTQTVTVRILDGAVARILVSIALLTGEHLQFTPAAGWLSLDANGRIKSKISAAAIPWDTPGTIGSTTPNTGAFTTVTSTVATGTPPLTVASTTRVNNLNVARAALADTVTTNANLTGPITSTGNATAVAAQTGTGTTFVMQASPTLTTPNIGAASGTSINLSGSATCLGLTCTVATGTPPLAVSSQTQVSNLNASLLGGFAASQTAGTASRVVVADASGYILNSYFNSTDDVSVNTPTGIMAKFGDNFLRTMSRAKLFQFMGQGAEFITGNYTVLDSDVFVNVALTTANITITLPAAGTYAGGQSRLLVIRRHDGTAFTLTIQRAGADVINTGGGAANVNSFTLAVGASAFLMPDGGTAWLKC